MTEVSGTSILNGSDTETSLGPGYLEENDGKAVGNMSRAPKFHSFGVWNKRLRLEWYREGHVSQKLHLSDRHRSTLGRVAGTYFDKMFTPCYANETL